MKDAELQRLVELHVEAKNAATPEAAGGPNYKLANAIFAKIFAIVVASEWKDEVWFELSTQDTSGLSVGQVYYDVLHIRLCDTQQSVCIPIPLLSAEAVTVAAKRWVVVECKHSDPDEEEPWVEEDSPIRNIGEIWREFVGEGRNPGVFLGSLHTGDSNAKFPVLSDYLMRVITEKVEKMMGV